MRPPCLSAAELNFLCWASDYYQHPLGDVIFHALPVRLRKGLKLSDARPKGWRLTAAGAAVDVSRLSRAKRQSAVLMSLHSHPLGSGTDAAPYALWSG